MLLFLAIFVVLLLIYFGLVNPWLKRRKMKVPKAAQPITDILGAVIDLLRF